MLPETDEFGREIAVPEVEAYRKEQREATSAESSRENGTTKLDAGDSEATAVAVDDGKGQGAQSLSATGEEPTRGDPVAGGDDQSEATTDVFHSKDAAQAETNEEEPQQGKEDNAAGGITAVEGTKPAAAPVLQVVTEVPSSISRQLALPQPKPAEPCFFLSTLLDAKAFTEAASKVKPPVAGLFSLRRMLSYTKVDTAEKTMEVPPLLQHLNSVIVLWCLSCGSDIKSLPYLLVMCAWCAVYLERRCRYWRRHFERCSHEMRWLFCVRL